MGPPLVLLAALRLAWPAHAGEAATVSPVAGAASAINQVIPPAQRAIGVFLDSPEPDAVALARALAAMPEVARTPDVPLANDRALKVAAAAFARDAGAAAAPERLAAVAVKLTLLHDVLERYLPKESRVMLAAAAQTARNAVIGEHKSALIDRLAAESQRLADARKELAGAPGAISASKPLEASWTMRKAQPRASRPMLALAPAPRLHPALLGSAKASPSFLDRLAEWLFNFVHGHAGLTLLHNNRIRERRLGLQRAILGVARAEGELIEAQREAERSGAGGEATGRLIKLNNELRAAQAARAVALQQAYDVDFALAQQLALDENLETNRLLLQLEKRLRRGHGTGKPDGFSRDLAAFQLARLADIQSQQLSEAKRHAVSAAQMEAALERPSELNDDLLDAYPIMIAHRNAQHGLAMDRAAWAEAAQRRLRDLLPQLNRVGPRPN